MPTNYTGDRTSGLAPSPTPDPESIPIDTLPADGDAANAASVAQAFKTAVNEIAWLKIRRAKVGAWTQPVARHQNALGYDRFFIDHMGYPQGRIIQVNQDWRDWLWVTDWPTSGAVGQPWWAFKTTGTLQTRAPQNVAPATPLFPTLKMTPPTAAAERVTLTGPGMCVPSNDLGAVLKASVAMDAVGANRTKITIGLGTGPSGSGGAAPAWGVWLEKAQGDTNWQVKANGTGSGPLTADSGVAPLVNGFKEMRVELIGANVSDDVAGHAIFYIDNVKVGQIDLDVSAMPSSSDAIVPFFNATTTTTGGAAVSLYLGPISYRHNTAINAL